MLFAESFARALLVLHTTCAVIAVAVSTHLVLWMRPWRRGAITRLRSVRRFAYLSAGAFTLTFLIGNLIYPVYKVRVRTEYLENTNAIERMFDIAGEEAARLADIHGPEGAPPPERESAQLYSHRAAKIARWFDVKEHWVSLGMALAIGCAVLLTWWNPAREGKQLVPMVFALALGAAATAWIGAIIGVLVTSYRSVG